jgi:hypothetical protein
VRETRGARSDAAGLASTVRRVSWPPEAGDLLPRAAQATGVREKLAAYSLNVENVHGAPKARSFERILGITIEHVDYLESAIRGVVDVLVRGLGDKGERAANVRTVWEIAGRDAAPRLVTAYPKP